MTHRSKLSPAAIAWRFIHASIAVGFVSAIGYVWSCALTRRRGPLLNAAVFALTSEGVLVALNHGDCPLGGLQRRLDDPVPFFELVLPARIAKRAVPALGVVTVVGLGTLWMRPPKQSHASYPHRLRHWWNTWGATSAEVGRVMPGDELIPDPDMLSTRAVTIHAPASSIWPWPVQMGSGRAGAYTYDWIENLFGLNMHSADAILPQFQDLAVGDALPMGKNGPQMRIEVLDRDQAMVYRIEDGNWTWAFATSECDRRR